MSLIEMAALAALVALLLVCGAPTLGILAGRRWKDEKPLSAIGFGVCAFILSGFGLYAFFSVGTAIGYGEALAATQTVEQVASFCPPQG